MNHNDAGNRLGRVVEIKSGRAVVDIGTDQNPVLTPPLKWCVPYAGTMNSQRVPSIGEQVLLTCVGDKNDLAAFVIAGYFHCDQYPPPNETEDQLTTKSDGYEATTTVQGVYTVNADVIASTVKTHTETSSSHTIESSSITLKGAITATMTMVIKKALSVAGIDFKGHKHTEQGDGNPTSGAHS